MALEKKVIVRSIVTLVKQDFKHFRHSLDDNYMLWRAGGSSMIIYDMQEQRSDEVVETFWNHQGELTKPISAIATSDAYRILGLSMDKNNSTVIHYYERNDQKIDLMSEIERRALDPVGNKHRN